VKREREREIILSMGKKIILITLRHEIGAGLLGSSKSSLAL
jgi:hypothetical protein